MPCAVRTGEPSHLPRTLSLCPAKGRQLVCGKWPSLGPRLQPQIGSKATAIAHTNARTAFEDSLGTACTCSQQQLFTCSKLKGKAVTAPNEGQTPFRCSKAAGLGQTPWSNQLQKEHLLVEVNHEETPCRNIIIPNNDMTEQGKNQQPKSDAVSLRKAAQRQGKWIPFLTSLIFS